MRLGKTLVSENEITRAIERLVSEIIADYGDADILFVGVMDGAICFLADLARAFPRSVELVTIRATSYEGTESRGELTFSYLPARERIEGRRVLIVEDIVDTGVTIARARGEANGTGRGVSRSMRPAKQAIPQNARGGSRLHRLQHPKRLRRRLRPGLQRPLQEPERY